jgi:hypothetical protein
MVEALASDTLVIREMDEPRAGYMSADLMRRYGLLQGNGNSRKESLASQIQAFPKSVDAERLMAFWPKSARMMNSPSAAKPEPVSLTTLAERCLRRLRGQPLD